VADRRDTLALGALLRGPLVGLTEEAIADEIEMLQSAAGGRQRFALVDGPVAGQKPPKTGAHGPAKSRAQGASCDAIPVACRGGGGASSAPDPQGPSFSWGGACIGNVELVLEMARAYAARGMVDSPVRCGSGGKTEMHRRKDGRMRNPNRRIDYHPFIQRRGLNGQS